MSISPLPTPKPGDYAMNFPQEREGDRQTAREVMKRNGCRAIRFEVTDGVLVAHGYISNVQGHQVEEL